VALKPQTPTVASTAPGSPPLRRAGLLRIAVAAAVAAVLLLVGELGNGPSYLAVLLAAFYGTVLASGLVASGTAGRGVLWTVVGDVALISLLVASTGGPDSPFSVLYLLAALGAAGSAGAALPAAIAVAGYLAAVAVPASLPPRTLAVAGFQSAIIALAFYLAGLLNVRLHEIREESEARADSLVTEEDYAGRLESAISRLGYSLGLLRPADILQWAAETVRDTVGGSYVHAALPQGNLHRTVAEEELESCPSWWHPEVQRLVLRSSRSGELLREQPNLPGIVAFTAAPISLESAPGMGALLVGGPRPIWNEAEERILLRIARETARALSGREEAPGGRDQISRLPNRASLVRVLQREWCYEGRSLLLHAGLEGFERYCEAYGVSAGEELLRGIGDRLGSQQRAFHLGADEFALLVGGNVARARRVALGVRQAVSDVTSAAAIPLTACVGIAPLGGPEEQDWTPAETLSGARRALERARQSEKGVVSATDAGAKTEGAEPPGVVRSLLEATQAHDDYLGEHLRSVSRMARALGRQLGMSEERLESLTTGALLHDVGKIGLRQSLLQKPGPLDGAEYEEMKLHPEFGVKILKPIEKLSHILPVVKYHHERYDGGGYPEGLKGEKIPLEARVTLVADALDSIVRDRAYRKGMELEAAVREISTGSGSQFDPEVVAALLSLLDAGDGELRLAN
jgi:HD-GYP domain-containing protein (c-di-GMP phosphodiesterase class II)